MIRLLFLVIGSVCLVLAFPDMTPWRIALLSAGISAIVVFMRPEGRD